MKEIMVSAFFRCISPRRINKVLVIIPVNVLWPFSVHLYDSLSFVVHTLTLELQDTVKQ